MKVYYVDREFPHHGWHSGYRMIANHVPNVYMSRSSWMYHALKAVPDSLFYRIHPFHRNWYNKQALALEIKSAYRMIRDDGLFHFLYGEHSFRWVSHLRKTIKKRSRVVATYHQLPEFFFARRKHFEHVKELDMVVLVSNHQSAFFEEIVEAKKIRFVPHGVDTDFFTPPHNNIRRDDSFVCLSVGSNYRDFDTQLQVIHDVNRHMQGVKFIVVGDPIHSCRFEGVENVRYLHGLSDEELLRAYHQADLLLMPLVEATASNALLEGMACGVPALVTDVGGVRDYVDENCALLAPSKDSEFMTDVIIHLQNNREVGVAIGRNARTKAVSYFDWKIIARHLRNIYSTV